jgi:hypothetical protein
MELTCDVHKWMRGYIVVHTNPYLAVSDATGKLKIEGIPRAGIRTSPGTSSSARRRAKWK